MGQSGCLTPIGHAGPNSVCRLPAWIVFAYAALVYTGKTDEEGYAGARKLMWYVEANKVPFQFTSPPGYHPPAAMAGAMKGPASGVFKMFQNPKLEIFMEHGLVFAGNPDSVYRQIVKFYEHVGGFGQLLLMGPGRLP